MKKLKIEMMSLENIRPYQRNPRKNERGISAVAMSIEEYGFSVPIIVDCNNEIIAGHTRYAAAQRLQMEKVPVIVKDDLTPEEVQAFRIADNKVAEFSSWDKDLLKVEFEALEEAAFDLLKTGFKEHEILKIINDVENKMSESDLSLDDIETFVEPGDVWELGKHRLICADSTEPETYEKLMKGVQASLLLTDPPYGVDYTGRSDRLTGKGEKIDNDSMGETALRGFLIKVFKAIDPYMKPGCSFYIFQPGMKTIPFRLAVRELKWKLSQVLIWLKQTSVMTRQHYHWIHEPILFGWKPGAAHYFTEDFTQKTVWGDDDRDMNKMSKRELKEYAEELKTEIQKGQDVIREDRPMQSLLHPTMKPVRLLGRLIQNSSIPGAVVLEPFSGSGSTIIACEQLDRICYAVELDPLFASGSIIRWQNETGEKAKKIK